MDPARYTGSMETTTETKSTTEEFFQNGGADETLAQASKEWEGRNPGRRVTKAEFKYAHPGRPGEGRYVGIEIHHELDRSYSAAG